MNRLFFIFILLGWKCFAQLPETDIWIFSIKNEKGNFVIQKGENFTKRPGYDNQPFFSANEKSIYYSSVREDKQSDIFEYSISSKKTKQLTKSRESEYSPTPIEGSDLIACVTVQQDSSQVIVAYGRKKGSKSSDPLEVMEWKNISGFDSVGYFTFLNNDSILYYKLTNPHTLRLRSLSTEEDILIASKPVRGFKALTRNQFVFGIKDSAAVWFFYYDCVLKKGLPLDNYLSLDEDIFYHRALGLLKSEENRILQFQGKEKKWKTLFDFSSHGIKKITRFAVDSKMKRIVIVNND